MEMFLQLIRLQAFLLQLFSLQLQMLFLFSDHLQRNTFFPVLFELAHKMLQPFLSFFMLQTQLLISFLFLQQFSLILFQLLQPFFFLSDDRLLFLQFNDFFLFLSVYFSLAFQSSRPPAQYFLFFFCFLLLKQQLIAAFFLFDGRLCFIQFFFQLLHLFLQRFLTLFIRFRQFLDKRRRQCVITVSLQFNIILQLLLRQCITLYLMKRQQLFLLMSSHLFFIFVFYFPQPFLYFRITLRMEQMPEDLLTVFCLCKQHALKVTLRQHGNLTILIDIQG